MAARMSEKQLMIIAGVVGVVLVGVPLTLTFIDRGKIAEGQKKKQQLGGEQEGLKKQIAEIPGLEEEIRSYQLDYPYYLTLVPEGQANVLKREYIRLLGLLRSVSGINRWKLDDLNREIPDRPVRGRRGGGPFKELKFSLSFTSKFANLGALLFLLETSGRFSRLNSLLIAGGGKKDPTLNVQMEVGTFIAAPEEPRPGKTRKPKGKKDLVLEARSLAGLPDPDRRRFQRILGVDGLKWPKDPGFVKGYRAEMRKMGYTLLRDLSPGTFRNPFDPTEGLTQVRTGRPDLPGREKDPRKRERAEKALLAFIGEQIKKVRVSMDRADADEKVRNKELEGAEVTLEGLKTAEIFKSDPAVAFTSDKRRIEFGKHRTEVVRLEKVLVTKRVEYAIRRLDETFAALKRAFVERQYQRVLDLHQQMQTLAAILKDYPAAQQILEKTGPLVREAKVHLTFASLAGNIGIRGTLIDAENKQTLVIITTPKGTNIVQKDEIVELGQFELTVKEIKKDEIVFLFEGVEVRKPIVDRTAREFNLLDKDS